MTNMSRRIPKRVLNIDMKMQIEMVERMPARRETGDTHSRVLTGVRTHFRAHMKVPAVFTRN